MRHAKRQTLKRMILLLSLTLLGLPISLQKSMNASPRALQQTTSPQHQDAPPPEPHPELKALVETIRKLLNEGKHGDALKKADELLQQATERGDTIGQVYAYHFRAQALQGLQQLEEALPLWVQIEQRWREVGDGAFVIEALLGQAFCLWRTDKAKAEQLVEQAVELAKAEPHRPLAAAKVLHGYGNRWAHRSEFQVARKCLECSLTLYERFAPGSLDMTRVVVHLGIATARQRDVKAAKAHHQRALAILESRTQHTPEHASLWRNLGIIPAILGDPQTAREHYRRAYEIAQATNAESLLVADILTALGAASADLQEFEKARGYLERSVAIYEERGIGSLDAGLAWFNLGYVFTQMGELSKARDCYLKALEIYQEVVPDSPRVARVHEDLASVCTDLGLWQDADQHYQQAETIYIKLGNHKEAARMLSNSGISAWRRGDLVLAWQRLSRAFEIQVKLDLCDAAFTLLHLGNVSALLGDLELSREYLERALRMFSDQNCNPRWQISAEMDLATTIAEQGDLREARRRFERVRAQVEGTSDLDLLRISALCWMNLGILAYREGNYEAALKCYRQVEAIYNGLSSTAPDELARLYNNISAVAASLNDLDSAERYATQSLEIRQRIVPDSLYVASILYNLAGIALRRGQSAQAREYLHRAASIIEAQRQTIADTESRSLFAERYFDVYPLLAFVYLQAGKPDKAAETLERSRARTLAEALQKRQLAFADAHKPLQELLQQQERLNERRLQTYRALRQTDPKDNETIAQHQRTLRETDQQQRALDEQLRQQFPTYAELLIPKPLSIGQIQQSLDAGMVLLYYALSEKELLILTVSRKGVQGYRVALKPKELEGAIRRFQAIVSKPPLGRTAKERQEMIPLSRKLYGWLVKPAEASLKGAQRVLLCPDGVLNLVPWGALVASVDRRGKPVYWIERAALHLTPSMGVYRQARQLKPTAQGVTLVAVSKYAGIKPVELTQARTDVEIRFRRLTGGKPLKDLEHASEEVQQLRKVFGKQMRVVAENQATPQQVRKLVMGARVAHFICHARADNTDPFGSVLFLAPPNAPAGYLAAGEVLTSWRLQADLVMLSACETGTGVLRQYEGMFGLARAFLFAGSRSVGASLWQVSDESTAHLMGAFYARYGRRVPKDVALREAQLELRRSQQYNDPFFWAGFILIGDYR